MLNGEKLFRVSWYVLIFFIPFETLQIIVSGFSIRLHQLLFFITLSIGLLIYRKYIPQYIITIKNNIFHKYFLNRHIYTILLIGIGFLYTIGGIIFGDTLMLSVIRSIALWGYIGVFCLVYYGIQTKDQLFEVFRTLLYSMAILVFFGLYEAIAFQLGWNNFMYFPGRVDSFFPEPNWFAICISFIYAIIIPLYYFSQSRKEKFLLGLMFVGITLSSILTMGRASWLTIGILIIIFIIQISISGFLSKKIFTFLIHIGLFTTISIGISQLGLTQFNLGDRFISIFTHNQVLYEGKDNNKEKVVVRDVNVDIRYQSYRNSFDHLKKSPIIGQGPTGEHNLFLGILVGSGILGLILFIILLHLLLKQSMSLVKKNPQMATLVSLITMSIIVTGIFNDSFLFCLIWLALAIAARITVFSKDNNIKENNIT
jgi:O-antigen ligase